MTLLASKDSLDQYYSHRVAVNYSKYYVPKTMFDLVSLSETHDSVVAWATHRYGPVDPFPSPEGVWSFTIGKFWFNDVEHALEFKLRWG